jgi:hypothetical protein
VLRDPSKTRIEDLKAIWHHLIARQTAGSQGLVFQKSLPKDKHETSDTSLQPGPTQPREVHREVNSHANADNREGPSRPLDPNSPAVHAISAASQMAFLRSLSSEKVYNKFVDLLNSTKKVSIVFVDINVLNYCT